MDELVLEFTLHRQLVDEGEMVDHQLDERADEEGGVHPPGSRAANDDLAVERGATNGDSQPAIAGREKTFVRRSARGAVIDDNEMTLLIEDGNARLQQFRESPGNRPGDSVEACG
uniref:Uncharacterized protein n=1 Tax=Thermorudis sp. TaxID=1969470 RepID=A0A7C3A9Y2_9BACT